jgi:alpha-galactosidase
MQEHPEWFLPADNGLFYPDFSCENVYIHTFNEICRLIDTYKAVWIKVDFNHELGIDPYSSEYYLYYLSFYKLFRELRAKYPEVIFESCAGGGMRMDIYNLMHFNGYWMSDETSPLNVLSIYQNALIRMNPGLMTKWACLNSSKEALYYDKSASTIITSPLVGYPWSVHTTTELDFAVLVVLPGMPGFSGDLTGLPQSVKERLLQYVQFYKKWRNMITKSIAYLTAPPVKMMEYTGWTSIQLQDMEETTSLLFVYRLDDTYIQKQFLLKGLEPDRIYNVTEPVTQESTPASYSGKQLMQDGILVKIDKKNNAKVFEIIPEN